MIIRQVYTIVLSFPTAHYISGWRPVTRTFHLVVFLLTDDDVVGIGEGTPYWSNIVDDYIKTLSLARKIQGLSIEDALNILRSSEYSMFRRREQVNYGAFLALESAVVHALAQSGKAVYEAELLGGVYRTEIPVAYTIFLGHPVIMSRRLKEAIKSGYKHVKFKIPCNLEELRRLLEALHSVRKQYGGEEIVLRADANECFSTLEKAEKALSVMEKYSINIVEQPLPRDRLRDIAELRKRFYPAIEIMLDESLRKPSDIELFAHMEVADIVNFHPSKLGCLTVTREAILKTQKLGLKANIGSSLMTEIGLFHYLNLVASIPRLDYPLEEPGLCNLYGYGVTRNPLEIHSGILRLQNTSSLISDLDFNLMAKFVIEKHAFLINQIQALLGGSLRMIRPCRARTR
jgi:L-alanine-DL-glutamate epimerase-like enolase superfamily enzyme